jgi:hypothetical protein
LLSAVLPIIPMSFIHFRLQYVAKAIQLMKAGSSQWMHEQTGSRRFEWQEGYGAFSIGASQVPATIRYIENQPQRHRKISLKDEWELFLRKHAIFIDKG